MSFANDVNRILKVHKEVTVDEFNGIVNELFSQIIMNTPVDTGRLRGNWQSSSTQPLFGVITSSDAGGGSAMSKIPSAYMRKFGDHIAYLTNSLPYAYRIEYEGWSHTKAPQGMVRKSARNIRKNLQ